MHKKLKEAIINWLFEHEKEWQRVNACTKAFKNYIYDDDGNYLIGGDDVAAFIVAADKLLYGGEL
jgi:hypothetical protein